MLSSVKPQTIANCWRHVQFMNVSTSSQDESYDDIPLAELRDLMSSLPSDLITMTAEEYVDANQITETEETLSDDTIIDMVRPNIIDLP